MTEGKWHYNWRDEYVEFRLPYEKCEQNCEERCSDNVCEKDSPERTGYIIFYYIGINELANKLGKKHWFEHLARQKWSIPHMEQFEELVASLTSEYAIYIRSECWKRTRQRILQRAKGRCESCGTRARLQVHHLNYDNLGNESPEDLQALCGTCHEKTHEVMT